MIRRGRGEGWLTRPRSTLATWARFNQITFESVSIDSLADDEAKGAAVIATERISAETVPFLIQVPRDLILCTETIEESAKCDKHLAEVLQAMKSSSGRVSPRTAVLVFLLMQATLLCPDVPQGIGVHSPLTDYITFLPDELLPTLWSEDELDALYGTSLFNATKAKLRSLDREFDEFRTATEQVDWCRRYWWDTAFLTLDDWKLVDAIYRSRALEFPGIGDAMIGDAMVPCIDMANHASGDMTGALYESDAHGNAVLQLREGKSLEAGDEVTITYGDDKGACEMIFSYGFLESTVTTARVVFLDFNLPDDDPLKPAKAYVATSAPGFRIFEQDSSTYWEGDYVYLSVVNEDDGLEFKVVQTTDGQRELQYFWKGDRIEDDRALKRCIEHDSMHEVYELRAVTLLRDRVREQLITLQEARTQIPGRSEGQPREGPMLLAGRLRTLEIQLLEKAYETLEHDQTALVASDVVQKYLKSRRIGTEKNPGDIC